ncbi:hypothetical protein YC2023_020213 [Brassica napus]
MDKRRCLYLSGMFTPSSVFICLFLRLLKVKTSLSCDLFRDEKGDGDSSPVTSFLVLFLDNCHGVFSFRWIYSPLSPADGSSCSFALQVSEGRRPLSPASLDGLKLVSFVLCSRDETVIELLKPLLLSACHSPVLQLLASHRRGWVIGITVRHLLENATSGVDFTAGDSRTRAGSTLLRLLSGWSRLRNGLRCLGPFSGCVLFGPVRF